MKTNDTKYALEPILAHFCHFNYQFSRNFAILSLKKTEQTQKLLEMTFTTVVSAT